MCIFCMHFCKCVLSPQNLGIIVGQCFLYMKAVYSGLSCRIIKHRPSEVYVETFVPNYVKKIQLFFNRCSNDMPLSSVLKLLSSAVGWLQLGNS